jgi:hypothetical protein
MPAAASFQRAPVTVLMSVYNGARFLNESVESIRNQTFDDFEFLIIDDGSNDESAEILAAHAAADRRIRILKQENRGLTAALNRGFEEATSEYVARMDADDVARPDRLQVQVSFLNSNPDITVVGSAIEVIDGEGRATNTIRLPEEPDRICRHMRQLGCALAHPTVVMRRAAVIEAGGLRRAYLHAEDYDLWLRMIERHRFANVAEVLLSYRRHEASVSSQYLQQQILSAMCARTVAKRRLEGKSDPTSHVELITRELILGLGVDERSLNAEVLRGLYEATEASIRQGRRSSAAEFLTTARPFADKRRLREAAMELNRLAAHTPASAEEQQRHRRLLVDAAPDLYREIFSGRHA